ncbi:hypothetical protein K2173_009498 [Erythroxylum novogranatense]|uniref:Fucosyltransferase n=1 Tax=Erythroxylum novogranatense TaxID=1862640 RepID=A0AAV8U428_9ROSI|nr:hypothetical protein K2173_009498 [Erythroxylum novogranatense]
MSSLLSSKSSCKTSQGTLGVDIRQAPSTLKLVLFNGTLHYCLMAFSLAIMLSIVYQNQVFYLMGFSKVKPLMGRSWVSANSEAKTYSIESTGVAEDMLPGESWIWEKDTGSCLSRFQSLLYRKISHQKISPYLLNKIRDYEEHHKRCAPYTEMYNRTIKELESGIVSEPTGCHYVVWTALEGLGNRILSMASAFLYAVITDRVFLVEFEADMIDLFCEPFPNTSWLLPADFPLKNQFKLLDQMFPHSYGNMMKTNTIKTMMELSPLSMYLYLAHDADDHDTLFFCQEHQAFLGNIPWLIIKSDQYFTPSLFLIPSFDPKLNKMFPNKEIVFHNLAHYLFQPSNRAWGLITRFYESYLAKADKRVGLQIRIFDRKVSPFHVVMDQILACTIKEKKILAGVNTHELVVPPSINLTTKAVVVTSLYSEYYEHIKNLYWMAPTVNGEVVGVYQPSHEGIQHFGDHMHNMKAWVEMNLLSLCDELITSSWSTFGYVSQGLGGLRPWILVKPENRMTPHPACGRAESMEPCYHSPPSYECRTGPKVNADLGAIVPHVNHCEDFNTGLKLFNKDA